MLRFILGYAAAFSALYAVGFWHAPFWIRDTGSVAWLAVMLIALPTAVAWAAAETLHALSPRRLFDHRVRGWVGRIAFGATCALLGATSAAFLLPLADRFLPESAILGGCAAACTLVPLACRARLRVGRCVPCGYDLRDITSHARGRCPECGATASAYERRWNAGFQPAPPRPGAPTLQVGAPDPSPA